MLLKQFFANRTVQNAGWLIGGKVLQQLINLAVGLLSARYLGPSNFGLLQYASAYMGFFAAFCTLGITSVLVKEFIANPGKEGEILGTSLILRVISSFLSAVVIFCVVVHVDADEHTAIQVVVLSSVGMILQAFDVFHYWFQSRMQSRVTAMVSVIAYAAMAVYKVILLLTGRNVVWFALATSVDYLFVGVLLLAAYRKHGGRQLCMSWDYAKDLLSRSRYFILPSLMVAVYAQTDKIMLKQMLGDAQIGYYSTAVSLSCVWCFVLQAIINSVYPSIMEAAGKDELLFRKRNRQLYAIVFYLSLLVSLLFTLFAEGLIWLLYGDAYLPAAAPLRVITWYTAFSYLGVARNAWIVSKDRQKYLLPVYALSACANVVLNVLLIPGMGTVGAAIASLVAQIMTVFVVPLMISGLRENTKLMAEAILLKDLRKNNRP